MLLHNGLTSCLPMTPRVKDNAASDAVEVLMSNGMEGLAGAVEILINAAMRVERLNREIPRRTKVASMFSNEASCLRLVTAVVWK